MMMPFMLLAALPFEKVFHFFAQGGVFMAPLILCSLIAVAVIVYRGLALRRSVVLPRAIENEIERIAPGGGIERLARIANNDESALARIVQTAISHLKWPKNENIEAVQTRARHEVVGMESGLILLEIITQAGPLLGLLGTLAGLVTVFGALGTSSASSDPRMVAAGIAEALNTTIMGLSVAVPALIAHGYFSKKVETMSAEMEILVADLLAKCYSEPQKPISGTALPTGRQVERSRGTTSAAAYMPPPRPEKRRTQQQQTTSAPPPQLPGFEGANPGELA